MKECLNCHRPFPREEIGRKWYCRECAIKRANEAGAQMQARQGPFYELWKSRTNAARKERHARS